MAKPLLTMKAISPFFIIFNSQSAMSSDPLPTSPRIQSLDILRGAVMVLMAIDHVRVYAGVPAGGPEPAIFFTRWITHFCAPAFVFFAGTAAFFYGRKINNDGALARYLFTRGLLLVVLELTVIRFGWTFNLNFSEFMLAGVIWMLGWCMIHLALIVWIRPAIVGIGGLLIIFFQQLFMFIPQSLPESMKPTLGAFLEFFYSSGIEALPGITILYVLIPWIGVMMAGYGFGTILLAEPEKRNSLCLRIGLSAILLFITAGTIVILNGSVSPEAPPFIFQLLNQKKYPASQLYLLMTLGPTIALIPLTEKARGWFADTLTVFGRVPFYYYLLHIPLIHISALFVNYLRDGSVHQEWYNNAPFAWVPPESQWNLATLYLVFFIDVIILYFACRWYVKYKFSHPEVAWLKYL
jgi:uncharacterized membrane protein